jgi:CHAD domain-containing protein
MDAAKHAHLLMTLMSIAVDPPLRQPAQAPDPAVVMSSVWKALARRAGAADGSSPDPVLHALRIRAKRVRYAAEALEPFVGDRAVAFAKAAARLQDVLGRHQDSVVTIDKLASWPRRTRARVHRRLARCRSRARPGRDPGRVA